MDIRELFQKGISFIDFVNQDKDTYREKTLEIYNHIKIEEEILEGIGSIHHLVHILVFAEIWCPDCMINVPAVQTIADHNSNFNISIVSREGNEDYMEDYKVNGKSKIPTFLIMDDEFNVLGTFVEQPQMIKEIEQKGKQVEIIVAKRKYRKGEYINETIKEILDISKK
ncbi:thioredoxin family protein [Inediibacterium massiliense]|uniref:thioredoxin family protein n=1 Tax=Inediibacterium massiliense TaxID=1658111 RepID=UPI0006B48BBB|nr:thioredoxin family protein [Inediibacterium massiliense]